MAFLSGFVKSGLSLLGKDASAFPYTIGQKVEWYENQSIWSLHRGVKKEDNSEVSIFTFDVTKNRDKVQLAKNAYKKMRTLRHPDLLRYLDGVENDQAIMIVTDAVEPLSDQLKQNPDSNLILWGLYKTASSLKFINNDCGMVHGNVRISSIFTNKAGEWKLGGFELLDSMKEESPMIMTFGGVLPDANRYMSPEINKSGWSIVRDIPTSATDSYQLGCLVYETYNGHMDNASQLLSKRGDIPAKMQQVYKALLASSPKVRLDAARFLDEGLRPQGFFSNEFIQVNLFLETLTIKDQAEKTTFFRKLDSVIEGFPQDFCMYKILPELINAFEFGSGGPKVLSSIMKVGSHLPDEDYDKTIIPCIIRMFATPDRAIRMSLLETLPSYVNRLSKKVVNEQIFPHVALGFTDGVPMIREQTIKGILLLVPLLSDRIINYDLLKYLAKLQLDEEPGIRTNTTICLGKVAKHLNAATQKKVLVPAFARSLKDGFHHARVAGLMALQATAEFYDAQDCSTRIVPCISLVLLDKEKMVRSQAFKTLDVFVKRITVFAEAMPDTALVERVETPNTTEIGPGSVARSNSASAAAAGVAGVLGEATKGFAGWAVNSLATRLTTPGEMPNSTTLQTTMSDPSLDKYAKTTVAAADTLNPDRLADRLALADLDDNSIDAWDDDQKQSDLIGLDEDEWEPLDTTQALEPEPITSFVPTRNTKPVITSTSRPKPSPVIKKTSNAGSMKLGHKPKFEASVDDWGLDEDEVPRATTHTHGASPSSSSVTSTTSGGQVISKEDKRAELDRRREERRQRMAELREKKKTGGIGAKKM
ncbi:Nuclear aminoacylation-dependent tRNA export pathway component [Umbelopsis sp. WA50703]